MLMALVIATKLILYKHREKRRFDSGIPAYSRLVFANEDSTYAADWASIYNNLQEKFQFTGTMMISSANNAWVILKTANEY